MNYGWGFSDHQEKKILMGTTHWLRTTDVGQIHKFLTLKSLFTHTRTFREDTCVVEHT